MGTKDKSVYFSARVIAEHAGVFDQFGTVTKLIRTRTGVSQPDWKRRIADHTNATTHLTGSFMSCESWPGWMKNNTTSGLNSWRGDYAAYHQSAPGPSVISITRASQKATSKALKQIRAAQVQMSGQVFLGELKEAMHMLRHPAEGLRKALKENYLDKLKRIKNRDPRRWQKAISQTWLEGTFGWRPFVNDLYDAASAYQEATNKLADRFKPIRAVGKDDAFVNEFNGFIGIPPGTNSQSWLARRTIDNAYCVIRGEVRASANTTALEKSYLFGLAPNEFVPTAWELLPWSFLVDYFTNIGDILENSVTDISHLAWSSTDKIGVRTVTATISPDPKHTAAVQGPTFIDADGSSSGVIWKYRTVDRSAGADLSIPPLMFELPGNPVQQLNIVALWAQAYYGLHPQKSFRR